MSWQQALQHANDLATQGTKLEASLATLGALVSPLPTLQKTFPLYVAAAQAYSHVFDRASEHGSNDATQAERDGIKKKWALVLSRAEKVKARIEGLGGVVPRAQVGEREEEESIVRRAGRIGGADVSEWPIGPGGRLGPGAKEFNEGGEGGFVGKGVTVEIAKEHQASAQWRPIREEDWSGRESDGLQASQAREGGRWLPVQGQGADCSVVAGLAACMSHNERWGTSLGLSALYPQDSSGSPVYSPNGKHLVRMMLNGSPRAVAFDSLIPYTPSGRPIGPSVRWFPSSSFPARPARSYPTLVLSDQLRPSLDSVSPTNRFLHPDIPPLSSSSSHSGPAFHRSSDSSRPPLRVAIPLLTKAHFTFLPSGYNTRGSTPSPNLYILTGWLPQRVDMRDLRREAGWKGLMDGWKRGGVLVTLGTGDVDSNPAMSGAGQDERAEGGMRRGRRPLIPRHAYAVLSVHEGPLDGLRNGTATGTGAEAGAGEGDRWVEVYDPGQPPASSSSITTTSQTLTSGIDNLHLNGAHADSTTISSNGTNGIPASNDYSTTSWYTWDEVCSLFRTLNLNWDPSIRPVRATRHWTWPKRQDAAASTGGANGGEGSMPRYRLRLTPPSAPNPVPAEGQRSMLGQARDCEKDDVWILLSQHKTSRTQPTDDIALHVVPDYTALLATPALPANSHIQRKAEPSSQGGTARAGSPVFTPSLATVETSSPYSNSPHIFYRHPLTTSTTPSFPSSRSSATPSAGEAADSRPIDLLVFPMRDSGIAPLSFSLHAYAPAGWGVSLERVRQSWAYDVTVRGETRVSSGSLFGHSSALLLRSDLSATIGGRRERADGQDQAQGWEGRLGGAGWGDESVQYRLHVGPPTSAARPDRPNGSPTSPSKGSINLELRARGGTAWNIALCWPATSSGPAGQAERLMALSSEGLIASSGPYRNELTTLTCALPSVSGPGEYIVALSTFDAPASSSSSASSVPSSSDPSSSRTPAAYSLTASSDYPVRLDLIPPFGAGMYHRTLSSMLSPGYAHGRPAVAGARYRENTSFDLIIGGQGPARVIIRALLLPLPGQPSSRIKDKEARDISTGPTSTGSTDRRSTGTVPINLTLFDRSTGGMLGDQMATSGPYDDAPSGIWIGASSSPGPGHSPNRKGFKLGPGVYRGVLSCWDRGMGEGRKWVVRTYSDRAVELESASA